MLRPKPAGKVVSAGRWRSAAVLVVVVLATCAAGGAGLRRVPVAWRAEWSVAVAGEGAFPGQAVSERAVATRQGSVRVYEPRTGALKLTVPAGSAPVTGVWIAGDTLVLARGEQRVTLYGHDLATGAPLWRRTVTVAGFQPRLDGVGYYHGPRILATGSGVVVVEQPDEPIGVQALDPRTGTTTGRATYPHGCRLTGAATATSVRLLSHCPGNELRLASVDPRTLRQVWTRTLPSSASPKGAGPPIDLTIDANGYARARADQEDFYLTPDGHPLPTTGDAEPGRWSSAAGDGGPEPWGPAAGGAEPGRWNPPLAVSQGDWRAGPGGWSPAGGPGPLPAYLVAVDPRTGRVGGLPIDLPAHLVTLAGTVRDLAFVYGDGRLTAYRMVYGTRRPEPAWPDACRLLTDRDLASFANGYRAVPAADGAARCDWIPPSDDGFVVSLSVEWVAPSAASAQKLFAAEAAATRRTNAVDPTTETPGFLSYTVDGTNGFHGGTIMNVGPVVARLTSPSRQAVRLLSPLLRAHLLARYAPGAHAPEPVPERGWSFPTDGAVRTQPVVSGGVVHATSADGSVYALDATTGALRWRYRMGGPVQENHAVARGTVYASAITGTLVALDAATGRPRWTRGIKAYAGLVVASGRLYVWTRRPDWSPKAELVALDAASGRRLWSFAPKGDVLTTEPVLTGDDVVLTAGGVLYALDPATGTVRRRHRLGTATDRVLLTKSGPTTYATTATGHVYALDTVSFRVRWRSRVPGPVSAPPLPTRKTVYAGDQEGTTYALNATTGTRRWTFRTKADQLTYTWNATVTDDLLYTAARDRTLYALDPATGMPRWHLPLPDGHATGPVIKDGTLHITDHKGTLHTIDPRTGTILTSFPTGGAIKTDPVVAGRFVYVAAANGNVYARPLDVSPGGRRVSRSTVVAPGDEAGAA